MLICFTFNWAHCNNSSQIGFTRNKNKVILIKKIDPLLKITSNNIIPGIRLCNLILLTLETYLFRIFK